MGYEAVSICSGASLRYACVSFAGLCAYQALPFRAHEAKGGRLA
jgi:hypothetical protein